jgi:drug/metabolite transporter (DMT)-like permease
VASKLIQLNGGVAGRFPFWLACIRFLITGLVLVPPAVRQLRRRRILFGLRDAVVLSGLGLLGVTIMSGLFHVAILRLPANVAAIVFSCNPVFVLLVAPLFLPEKITSRKLAAAGICLLGVVVLARGRTDGVTLSGLCLMLASVVIFAFYTVLSKKLIPRYGALPVIAFAGLSGGLLLIPPAFLMDGFPVPAYTGADWAGIAYLSLFGTALGYFLYIYGIGHVEAGIGSMAFFLKPFLAALFAWLVLGEGLTVPMLAGGALIFGGMTLALFRFRNS